MPFSLGFFVAPSDLMERNGSFMKKEYHGEIILRNSSLKSNLSLFSVFLKVIAGRRLGLWASICVKASKGLSATLPMSTVYRKMTPTVDGNIICDFATVKESGGHDVPGSFVLALDQPMVLMESAITEIKQITGIFIAVLQFSSSKFLDFFSKISMSSHYPKPPVLDHTSDHCVPFTYRMRRRSVGKTCTVW
jgi:hypothetical protein